MSIFTVLGRLGPHIEREVNLILNSKHEAETLKSKLEKIQEGLQDAERQGVVDMNVKRWLKELEDVMYAMDDALDIWETKNLELKNGQPEYKDVSDPWEKVRSLFISLCLCFEHVVGRREITLEMKALSARLDRILEEKGRYNFVNSSKVDSSREVENHETTSSLDESKVYGRKSDRDSLVECLLAKDENNGNGARVISIVGIGGLGKTTLAQLVYNDPRVEEHFDLKAWVSVPNPFDASMVAKAVLEAFDESSNGYSTLENLGRRIKAVVSKQSFFLVLDNVWTVDRAKWESLKYFLVGERGCRILVITRDEVAARTMGTTHWQLLNLLSDLDCAVILTTITLEGRTEKDCEEFCRIGLEIAKKCNGLPLAAKTIGHMLESRFTIEEWRDVLESPWWKYEDELSDIFLPLRLSYTDLSPILKRCFLSCVLYSKGSQLDAAELIRIWMAQGYISSTATWDQVQSQGIQYLQKLLMRSFFQELERDEGNLTCNMHDVRHEFAKYLSRSEHYLVLDDRTHEMALYTIGRTHNFCARSISPKDLPPNFCRLLKHVRVLCLSKCGLKELSEEVGELIHLRYLDLSGNPIEKLPETLCDLLNLQTLNLRGCSYLSRLPHGVGKLMNLRHLLNSYTSSLRLYPQGLEKLTGLWTLDEFRATRDSAPCLRNLNQLQGYLEIKVEDLNDAAESKKANLRDKNYIKSLRLVVYEDVSMDIIEDMAPPPRLQSLYIGGELQQLPSWITTTSALNKLEKLKINGSHGSSSLPPLGKLPMLETLRLCLMRFERVTLEFWGTIPKGTSNAAAGGFPRLKKLHFFCCFSWQEWEDLEEEAAEDSVPAMPCLKELKFSFCDRLQALPHGLLFRVASSLQKLSIYKSECLESRYHQEFGADRDKISHIPYINISGSKISRAIVPEL